MPPPRSVPRHRGVKESRSAAEARGGGEAEDAWMLRFGTASGMKAWSERGEACLMEVEKLIERSRTYFGIAQSMGDSFNRLHGGRHGLNPLVPPRWPSEMAQLDVWPEGARRPEFVRPAPPEDPKQEEEERRYRDQMRLEEERSWGGVKAPEEKG